MHKNRQIVILSGKTSPYEGNGRKFGYPTANISTETDLKDGIYFGFADLGNYKNNAALIFIGKPITVGNSTHRVEAHLLDIKDEDYYGKKLKLDVCKFHRANLKLSSIDELIEIMKADEAAAREWFLAYSLLPSED